MRTDLVTKVLQGDIFVNFCEVIIGWKHMDKLQMLPPSTKERVVNLEKLGPS